MQQAAEDEAVVAAAAAEAEQVADDELDPVRRAAHSVGRVHSCTEVGKVHHLDSDSHFADGKECADAELGFEVVADSFDVVVVAELALVHEGCPSRERQLQHQAS